MNLEQSKTQNDLDQSWQRHEHLVIDKTPPDSLYHYTTATGLMGIIRRGGMYASPYFLLNDPSELKYGWEIVKEVCEELHSHGNPTETRIADSILSSEYLRLKKFSDEFPVFHIISFSSEEDNLSQWRCYSDDGRGISLEVNTSNLQAAGWVFCKCIYERSEQKAKISQALQFCARFHDENSLQDLPFTTELSFGILWHVVSLLKHPSYIDEDEWRVRQIRTRSADEAYINGAHFKASILCSFQNVDGIKRIWVGPKNNFEGTEFAIRAAFNGPSLLQYRNFEIIMSNAPYR